MSKILSGFSNSFGKVMATQVATKGKFFWEITLGVPKGTGSRASPNGLTFRSGTGVYLVWHFAILTLQVFVAAIIRKYILTLPENDTALPRLAVTLTPATADGMRWLPLHIEPVA
ncbi:hypothetical protein B0H13DRAFT_1866391 [Mycena leptocephala]|nr:hypothetical protein B0H13DRAFT_1866391 [Mycena leptocephala]